MPKYRVAVIGHTGRGNYGHGLDTVWSAMPDCEVVGVADPHEGGRSAAMDRIKAPRGFAKAEQLLSEVKPDIVAICPRWLDQHRDLVLLAARHGAHIYMEKPMCRTLAEADEMVKACETHNVKLAIAHQTRYSPILQVLRDLIDDGKIGEILELRGRGKEDRRGGGEDLWVLGSHIMNLMHYFAGQPTWCFARVLQEGKPVDASSVVEGGEGIGPLAGDHLNAMYGYEDGVTGYFGSKRNASGGRFGLQIFGSKGVIDLTTGFLPRTSVLFEPTWAPGRSKGRWVAVSSNGVGKPETLQDSSHRAGNVEACRDLIDAIAQDRHPEASVYEARNTVEMIAAVFESHRLKGPTELPLPNRSNPLARLTSKP